MKQLVCATALLSFALASSAATIRIDPAAAITTGGGTVDIEVEIADVVDLYAYQFDIAFNPAGVSAVSVTQGAFLADGGATLFIPGAIDNALGAISFTANTLLGPVSGVSGTGTLATIRFAGIGLGTTPVSLSNVVLLNSASAEIQAAIQDGSLAAVPEPSTMAMLTLGGAILAMRRFRSISQALNFAR